MLIIVTPEPTSIAAGRLSTHRIGVRIGLPPDSAELLVFCVCLGQSSLSRRRPAVDEYNWCGPRSLQAERLHLDKVPFPNRQSYHRRRHNSRMRHQAQRAVGMSRPRVVVVVRDLDDRAKRNQQHGDNREKSHLPLPRAGLCLHSHHEPRCQSLGVRFVVRSGRAGQLCAAVAARRHHTKQLSP